MCRVPRQRLGCSGAQGGRSAGRQQRAGQKNSCPRVACDMNGVAGCRSASNAPRISAASVRPRIEGCGGQLASWTNWKHMGGYMLGVRGTLQARQGEAWFVQKRRETRRVPSLRPQVGKWGWARKIKTGRFRRVCLGSTCSASIVN